MMRPSKAEAYNALLRQRLAAFTRKTFHTVSPGTPFLPNYHTDLIAEYLEACRRREITRLIVNIPPRYMKSISVTIAWPAWLLGHNPSERIIASSFAERLALKHSVDCRLVLQSEWYRRIFPDTILTGDQNEKGKFVTTARGHRIATSVGSSALGEGGDYLIVDDPIDPRSARSKAQLEDANEWFDQSFITRLDDKKQGVVVLVMQRLAQGDMTDHLLGKGGYEHCCLPAVAEQKTIVHFGRVNIIREAGEPLHAAREGIEEIEKIKREMTGLAFAGQYQQRPAPAEGGMFKMEWLEHRYEQRRETYQSIVQSWDTASKAKELNDPSCCTTWGMTENGHELLHVLVVRKEYPALKKLVQSHAESWAADAVLIEDKASGMALIQDLRKETKLPVVAINPVADKVTRASAASPLVESGKVTLPKRAEWLPDFESELFAFPNSVHDDQVDSLSQYLNWAKMKASYAGPRIRRV